MKETIVQMLQTQTNKILVLVNNVNGVGILELLPIPPSWKCEGNS